MAVTVIAAVVVIEVEVVVIIAAVAMALRKGSGKNSKKSSLRKGEISPSGFLARNGVRLK